MVIIFSMKKINKRVLLLEDTGKYSIVAARQPLRRKAPPVLLREVLCAERAEAKTRVGSPRDSGGTEVNLVFFLCLLQLLMFCFPSPRPGTPLQNSSSWGFERIPRIALHASPLAFRKTLEFVLQDHL